MFSSFPVLFAIVLLLSLVFAGLNEDSLIERINKVT